MLAAVLHGMLYLVRDVQARCTRPDFAVLGAMLYYIDTFPERHHHPKEDRYLFARLRERCPQAGPILDRLEQEHRSGANMIRDLQQALARCQHGGEDEFPAFSKAVEDYANFHWAHMRCEEDEILPLAERHLTSEDCEAIDAAFADHSDPLVGIDVGDHYRRLFQRIVNMAPPPIGVGPARPPSPP